ncbi:sulfotransferase family protein [Mangrovihabitans endophyticus]|uniref:Sulfotransferase family protein n=1 Tax=Mangrovihabitans endophyticus TaxID=1751298 RepID=A0A8J3FNF7_9ACTN|nr:sulfotransferase family protein [Mangrovihabitans endophyticus]
MYIAGWGRSGTTIVDNVLNSYDAVFSTGELSYLWSRGVGMRRRCGCGETFDECPLWQKVLSVAYGGRVPDPRHVIGLQQRAVRARHTRSLLNGPLPADAAEYLAITARLYNAIAEVTGAGLIVDSSKTPSGAALLSRMPGIRPYLLHMVRDPRAVAHSWTGAAPPPETRGGAPIKQRPASSTVHWVVRNAMTERVAGAYPQRHLRLRYEDFVAWPRPSVRRVLDLTATGDEGDPFTGAATVALRPNHNVAGNPGRLRNGEIELRLDNRWRDARRRGLWLTSTALAMPLLHRYGYHLRPL